MIIVAKMLSKWIVRKIECVIVTMLITSGGAMLLFDHFR
jgi:hypothetical protein